MLVMLFWENIICLSYVRPEFFILDLQEISLEAGIK